MADDGVDALMRMIENRDGVASGKIYNVGNPANEFSVRELATMMVELALDYPEYREAASRVQLVETTSSSYYGAGYQDVQPRMPRIANTTEDLGWTPKVEMSLALRYIYDAYRNQVAEARGLVD